MTTRTARTLTAAVAGLAALTAALTAVAPADAATPAKKEVTVKVVADPAGDITWYEGYKPTKAARGLDLRNVKTSRPTAGAGRNTLSVELTLTDLNAVTNAPLYWRAVHIATSAGGSFGMNDAGEFYDYTNNAGGTPVECGLTVAKNIVAETVTFKVPVACFGGAESATVTAASGKSQLDGDVIGRDQARSLKGVDLRTR